MTRLPSSCRAARIVSLALLLWLPRLAGGETASSPQVEFNRQVRPILADKCFRCHGPDRHKRKADLRLDLREAALAADDEKPAIVPGRPQDSEAYRRITAKNERRRMPPVRSGLKLTADEIHVLRRWIEQGAPYQPHWSFLAPQSPPLPRVRLADWPRNALDYFVLARLEQEGLRPSPEAARTTLLRRVTLDLTGLPPTPAEVDAFLADDSADAYEKVVDRLLRSPRYGERRALDWLDAARYADTNGYFSDRERSLWRWRDWVIHAFNQNKPFDQFTVEQLAGDLLPGATQDHLVATGFNRNHVVSNETGIIDEEYRVEYVADRLDTTATVWLGLTAGCARCHDHKYDPLSQKEYYQLFAFFNNGPEKGLVKQTDPPPLLSAPTPEQQRALADVRQRCVEAERQVQALGPALRSVVSWKASGRNTPPYFFSRRAFENARSAWQRLRRVRRQEEELRAAIPTTLIMQEMDRPRETFVLVRGQYDKHGSQVDAGVPAVLPPLPPGAPANRLGLARWLVSPAHPLTARVAVNRFWQHLFGEGLVKSVNDFGTQGEFPSHPELLDWLAVHFMRGGWDVKALHKLMVMSAAYRQSSVATPELLRRDPENRLLARGPRFRLPAEVIRDQALAASGLLIEKIGGPSVKPYQPPGLWEEVSYNASLKYIQDRGAGLHRRSLYTYWKRQAPPPAMLCFDGPTRETCTVKRQRTNTPLQALVLLNDPTFVEAARALAARAINQADTPTARLHSLFGRVLARPPRADEVEPLLRLFRQQREEYRDKPHEARKLLGVGETSRDKELDPCELAAWTTVASVVLNLDEAITKP